MENLKNKSPIKKYFNRRGRKLSKTSTPVISGYSGPMDFKLVPIDSNLDVVSKNGLSAPEN